MARTDAGAALTARHHGQQVAVRSRVLAALLRLWRFVDPTNLAGTINPFSAAAAALVQAGHRDSARTASAYYVAFRSAEGARGAVAVALGSPPDADLISIALRAAGLAGIIRARQAGATPQVAADRGFVRVAGSASNLVLDGGRQTITDATASDPAATGLWLRVTDADPCAFCAMLAARGAVFSARTAKFEAHGACVLGATTVGGPRFEAAFRRWYEGELVIIGLPDGGELAITPKHPVLTDRGWVDAGLLSKSDRLVHSGARGPGSVAPNEHHAPSSIEDVWRTGRVNGLVSMPVAAEDFHGDGVGSQGEVDVVTPYRLLPGVADAAGVEFLAEQVLARAGDAGSGSESFARRGGLGQLGLGLLPASGGCVCGLQLGADLFRGEGRNVQPGGIQRAATLDVGLAQPTRDHAPGDAIPAGDRLLTLAASVGLDERPVWRLDTPIARTLTAGPRFDPPPAEEGADGVGAQADLGRRLLERLAGGVQLRRVVDLRRVGGWSGHVFNLRTSEGWYAANSLVVSNCSCQAEPEFEGSVLPAKSLEFADLWSRSTPGLSGKDAENAFRRALEGRSFPDDPIAAA
jgi:hypothetical protein